VFVVTLSKIWWFTCSSWPIQALNLSIFQELTYCSWPCRHTTVWDFRGSLGPLLKAARRCPTSCSLSRGAGCGDPGGFLLFSPQVPTVLRAASGCDVVEQGRQMLNPLLETLFGGVFSIGSIWIGWLILVLPRLLLAFWFGQLGLA